LTSKRLFSLLLLVGAGCAPAAFADTVSFTLLSPAQSGPEGTVFTYEATVTNTNTAVEYLNADSVTTSGPLAVDDSDFYNDFPLFLNPGESFTGNLFTVTATDGSANTTTTGFFDLQGGPDAGDQGVLGTVSFSAAVTPAVAATPEPSSLWLLATGIAGGVGVIKRRRA
jgi:hypothetical protein